MKTTKINPTKISHYTVYIPGLVPKPSLFNRMLSCSIKQKSAWDPDETIAIYNQECINK